MSNIQSLWVGIGCQRGTSAILIDNAVKQVFQQYHLSENAIAGIATIDSKAGEIGLVEFCHSRNLPLKTFSAEHLATVQVPHSSQIVEQKMGTASVAEAAALLAAQFTPVDRDLQVKLLVCKQICRFPQETKAVTLAVAVHLRNFNQ